MEGHAPDWSYCASDLKEYFEEFLLAQSFTVGIGNMTRRKRQAMVVLSGAILQLKLRGDVGAASMTKWK